MNFSNLIRGGAHAIRATKIGCEPARKIAKSCVKGSVATGWTAVTWAS